MKKKLYEMNKEELLKRRRYEQTMGLFFSVMSILMFLSGMILFEAKGTFYGLILPLACSIIMFIVIVDCSQNLNNIGLHIYLRDRER